MRSLACVPHSTAPRARGQEVEHIPIRNRDATLELEPGVWWIAVEYDGGLLSAARRYDVRRGTRDTVRIAG